MTSAAMRRVLLHPGVPHFAFLLVALLVLKGKPVPLGNEWTYLALLVKRWNPHFLALDWTFSGPWPEKLVFNALFGPLTLLFSLETVGWIGRVGVWVGAIIALSRLGRQYDIPRGMVTLSIFLWLLYRGIGHPSVGGEWMVDGFEAKAVAYVVLIFALTGFSNRQSRLPWVLLGCVFSLHPAIGFWAALAVGLALPFARYPSREAAKGAVYAVLFALPGLVPVISLALGGGVLGEGSATAADRQFFVLVRSPSAVDPFTFPIRDVLLLYLFLVFNWLHARPDPRPAVRFLCAFQVAIGVFFGLGFVFRGMEEYGFLKLFPFRLFALFMPLFFLFHLMSVYHHRSSRPASLPAVAVGFVALLSMGNPISEVLDTARDTVVAWKTRGPDDIGRTFLWVAEHTPDHAVVISPPWRRDSFYRSQRAQIASWNTVRNDRLGEWRERIAAMVGTIETPLVGKELLRAFEAAYAHLSEGALAQMSERYGAQYLISKGRYRYPVLFASGEYRVYLLNDVSPGPARADGGDRLHARPAGHGAKSDEKTGP